MLFPTNFRQSLLWTRLIIIRSYAKKFSNTTVAYKVDVGKQERAKVSSNGLARIGTRRSFARPEPQTDGGLGAGKHGRVNVPGGHRVQRRRAGPEGGGYGSGRNAGNCPAARIGYLRRWYAELSMQAASSPASELHVRARSWPSAGADVP